MEYYQARSLKLIEKMILSKRYAKKSQVRDHLSFLGNLANNLNEEINELKSNGVLPWQKELELNRVKDIYSKLNQELINLESSSFTDDKSVRKGLF